MIFGKKQSDLPGIRFSAVSDGSGGYKISVKFHGATGDLLDMAAYLAAEIIYGIHPDYHPKACRFFGESVTSALEQMKQRTEEIER